MDYSNFKPLGKQVLFRRDKVEEKKIGSILIPSTRTFDARWGTVLAVGKGRYINGSYVPLEIGPGDRILCHAYDGDRIDLEDDRIQIITEDIILASIEKEDAKDLDMGNWDS